MVTEDGRYAVVFNGEIYNYPALRRELEARGVRLRTTSDTEVLLHLYAREGTEMVHRLRGMFALAIWDNRERRLFLARDHLGIKPLYYADDGWTFRFASQVKALLAGGAIGTEPDPAGQVGFYLLGSVPEPFTTIRAIRALPAGATLIVDRIGGHEPRHYYSVAQAYCDAEDSRASCGEIGQSERRAGVSAALLDSVRHHLIADVPVGAFLSGGTDSSALVGLMRDAGQQEIQTVTLTFSEFQGRSENEAPLAAEVARLYGTRHHTRLVTRTEFDAELPRILAAMDQPSIDGINTWFASKAAQELGLKVAISGLGGDELFGGYPSFYDVPNWVRLFAAPSRVPFLGKILRVAGEPLVSALGKSPKSAGLVELGGSFAGAYLLRRGLFMPWELDHVMDPDIVRNGLRRLVPLRLIGEALKPRPHTAHAKMAVLESSLYMRNQLLRDTDWASMAHSLEVRVPLVDPVLLRASAPVILSMAPARTKAPKACLALSPSVPVPDFIVAKAKTGFTIPMASWLCGSSPPARSGRMTRNRIQATQHWSRQWAERLVSA